MKQTTKTGISVLLLSLLFKWNTSAATEEDKQAEEFLESEIHGNAEEMLKDIGQLERVGSKYVIPDKKPLKIDRHCEATVNERVYAKAYQPVEEFFESETHGNAEEMLKDIGQLESGGRKYVIPDKKQLKIDRHCEATVNESVYAKAYQPVEEFLESEINGNAEEIFKVLLKIGPLKRVCRKYVIPDKKQLKIDRYSEAAVNESVYAVVTVCRIKVVSSAKTYLVYFLVGITLGVIDTLLKCLFDRLMERKLLAEKTIVKRPNAVNRKQNEFMWNQDVFINKKIINFKLDTGAYSNVIPLWLYNDLKLYENSNLCEVDVTVIALGVNIAKVECIVTLMCSTERVKEKELDFVVVNLPCEAMLGLYGCEIFKLISRNNI